MLCGLFRLTLNVWVCLCGLRDWLCLLDLLFVCLFIWCFGLVFGCFVCFVVPILKCVLDLDTGLVGGLLCDVLMFVVSVFVYLNLI